MSHYSRMAILTAALLSGWSRTGTGMAQGTGALPLQSQHTEIEAINRVLAAQDAGYSARDADALLATYADDAKIDSAMAGRRASKAQYAVGIRKGFTSGRVGPRVESVAASVSFSDPTHATVAGELLAHSESGRVTRTRTVWKFEKRGDRWLIVDRQYGG